MNLDLHLSNRQDDVLWSPAGLCDQVIDERPQRLKLRALDIDLEHVDEMVSVDPHERLQTPHGRVLPVRVTIGRTKRVRPEMRPISQVSDLCDLGPERVYAKVVAVYLATWGTGEDIGFKGRFTVNAEGVDDAGWLVG